MQSVVSDLDSKRSRLSRHRESVKGVNDERLTQLEKEVEEAKKRVEEGKIEYERIREQMKFEMERFHGQKFHDFKRFLLAFVHLQVDCCRQMESQWRSLLPELESMGNSSVSGAHPSKTDSNSSGRRHKLQQNGSVQDRVSGSG
mmetsp:Transcript_13465/g.22099  ORF Transcript_13465/g.22099 Transcript_13465/m.22099 type:complete len:144 (-) Transcript_13465:672-1103(-)